MQLLFTRFFKLFRYKNRYIPIVLDVAGSLCRMLGVEVCRELGHFPDSNETLKNKNTINCTINKISNIV